MRVFTIKNTPNIISICRIVLSAAMVTLFFFGMHLIAGAIYIVAAVSDIMDGFVARRFDAKSGFGAMLDPLSDKILHVSVIICFAAYGMIPFIIAILFTIKEIALIIGAVIFAKKGKTVIADIFGKVATLIQFVGVVLAFSALTAGRIVPYLFVITVALVLSYASLIHYAKKMSDSQA